MKKHFSTLMILIMVLYAIAFSCSKGEVSSTISNEVELITTIRLTFREAGSSTVQVFEYKDPDGDGGNPPTKFDPIVLNARKNYSCNIEVLNESVNPAVDKTPEIIAEANDHQFYFEPVIVNIAVTNLNSDSKNLPFGISSTWNTGVFGNGTVKISLKHKPGTKADGDLVSKGKTDFEVNFIARLQ